ncbi:2-phospho-L-lactate guanylyltransferase [Streptomyces sp. UNOC14_S4]|uniref:2-phospho-L-lactate guanylyltransferase n=1 Tax=Streptomyces sp. UNOC14_S4 TaxID=2872340 RepID=UPI001E44C2E4|nr:2-phospho-L-lactate guanylyltransferase [Streptomyces sp. UNOC14_S4]MCC3770692.1 2-phospho-L-lactate guanylyltransferase [Streptomyces sp. UNOC14_S4]
MVWTLVVPVKPLSEAKSRLAGGPGRGPDRTALALAFAQDTVAAALSCHAVAGVVVVTDDPVAGERLGALGARVLREPAGGKGLNGALAHGARSVRAGRPGAAVATLNADLPALRAVELGRVLDSAEEFPRSFLADAAGIGTTLLAAAPGMELAPAFEGQSRNRHRASGAHEIELTDVESVRRDVDTAEDLRAALALGVGPRTAAAAAVLPQRVADRT